MGQVALQPSKLKNAALQKEDERWIALDMSIVSDADFCSTVLEEIPALSSQKASLIRNRKASSDSNASSSIEDSSRGWKSLVSILSTNSHQEPLLSTNIPQLKPPQDIKNLESIKTQATVLQRFHYAIQRDILRSLSERDAEEAAWQAIAKAKAAANSETSLSQQELETSQGFKSIVAGSADSKNKDVDPLFQFPLSKPEGFFLASSIEMNLTVARTMAAAGMPSVVKGVCETLLRLMTCADGAIFESVPLPSAKAHSWTTKCLTSIETFAGEVSAGIIQGVAIPTESRGMGAALELGLALQHGKLAHLLNIALKLYQQHILVQENKHGSLDSQLHSQHATNLPPQIIGFLEQIAGFEPKYSLHCSSKGHHIGSAPQPELGIHVRTLGLAAADGYAFIICQCLASPSDELQSSVDKQYQLFKIGTGMSGTREGKVYVKSAKIDNRTFANSLESSNDMGRVYMGVLAGDRLVVFFSGTPDSVICFSMKDLSLLGKVKLVEKGSIGESPRAPHVMVSLAALKERKLPGTSPTDTVASNQNGSSNGSNSTPASNMHAVVSSESKTESISPIEEKTQAPAVVKDRMNKVGINSYAMCTDNRSRILIVSQDESVKQDANESLLALVFAYDCSRQASIDNKAFLITNNHEEFSDNIVEHRIQDSTQDMPVSTFKLFEYPAATKLRKKSEPHKPVAQPNMCAWYCNGPTLVCTTPKNPISFEMCFNSRNGKHAIVEQESLEDLLSWDAEKTPQGRGLRVFNNNLSVETLASPSGYAAQVSKQLFRQGKHKIVIKVDQNANDDSSLYIGVADAGRGVPTSSGSSSHVWTMQADGYTYASGDSSSGGPRIRSGTILTFILDLNNWTFEIFHSANEDAMPGQRVRRMSIERERGYWLVCIIGGIQKVTIIDYQSLDVGEDALAPLENVSDTPISSHVGTGGQISVQELLPGPEVNNGSTSARNPVSLAFDCKSNALLGLDNVRRILHKWSNLQSPRVWWNDDEDDDTIVKCNPTRIFARLIASSGKAGGGLSPGDAAVALLAALDCATAYLGHFVDRKSSDAEKKRLKKQKKTKLKSILALHKKNATRKKPVKTEPSPFGIAPDRETFDALATLLRQLLPDLDRTSSKSSKQYSETESTLIVFCLRIIRVQLKNIDLNIRADALVEDFLQFLRQALAYIVSDVNATSAMKTAASSCFKAGIPIFYENPVARLRLLISALSNSPEQDVKEGKIDPTKSTHDVASMEAAILASLPEAIALATLPTISDTLSIYDVLRDEPTLVLDAIQCLINASVRLFLHAGRTTYRETVCTNISEELLPLLVKNLLSLIVKKQEMAFHELDKTVQNKHMNSGDGERLVQQKTMRNLCMQLVDLFCSALLSMLSSLSDPTPDKLHAISKTPIGKLAIPVLIASTVVQSDDVFGDVKEICRMREIISKLKRTLNETARSASEPIYYETATVNTFTRMAKSVRESPHNYLPNMNHVEEVTFPRLVSAIRKERNRIENIIASAKKSSKPLTNEEVDSITPDWLNSPRKISIVWDSQTKTESGCDYIQVGFSLYYND